MTEPIEQTDAVVIGAGVIGCAIAWRLGQAGKRVVVVERGRVGGEASHAAGGMLAPLVEAEREDEFFNLTTASLAIYPDFARELKASSGVDVAYRDEGTLYLALTDEDEEELERRWQWLNVSGLNVKRLNAGCALKLEPLLNQTLRFALKFPGDHQVDNRRLMIALHGAARNAGVEFLTHTEARELLTENIAGRGRMASIEMPAPAARNVIYSRRGYLVPRLGGYLIAGSTTERVGYDKRVTVGGMASVIKNAIEIMPRVASQAVIETWAGLRPRAPDDLPILGADSRVEGLIYATGHYRNGILLAPITARAIGELIASGESSVDLAPFSVARFANRRAVG